MPLLKISDAFLATIQSPGGSSAGGHLLLPTNPMSIGRELSPEGRGIVLSHGSVSRMHARIELRGFSLFLIDEGSTNGTFVTSRARWTEKDRVFGVTMLQYGDFISIGREYTFQLELRHDVGSAKHLQEFEHLKTDAPTGLPSERYLDWCLEREALKAQQQRQSLAFVVLRIQRRPGLAAEEVDQLFVDLAKVVKHQQKGGLIGRFGQRSLGVLLKGQTAKDAAALGYEVRRRAPSSMGVRFGAAEILNGDKDPAEALRSRVLSAIDNSPGQGSSER
jgi:GGDEF domain-containing protein